MGRTADPETQAKSKEPESLSTSSICLSPCGFLFTQVFSPWWQITTVSRTCLGSLVGKMLLFLALQKRLREDSSRAKLARVHPYTPTTVSGGQAPLAGRSGPASTTECRVPLQTHKEVNK